MHVQRVTPAARATRSVLSRRMLNGWHWCGCVAIAICAACEQTPIDAIVPAEQELPPDPCAVGVDALVPGSYRLQAVGSEQCLAVGEMTTVLGTRAHSLALVDDCIGQGEIWDFMTTMVMSATSTSAGLWFEVTSSTYADNIDIEAGQTADGTRAVLYAPADRLNQKFLFRPRADRVFELAPAHVASQTSCISAANDELTITHCAATDVEQSWRVLPASCAQ